MRAQSHDFFTFFEKKSFEDFKCAQILCANLLHHPCNKSPSAIAVTIVAAIAGVRTYESVPLYAVPL